MDSKYFGIPDAAEGLQWTDNTAELANRYYKRLASLDQFAKAMWLNNKVDVTKPDYSNPQSIAASQAYQQELGNIMAIANELMTSRLKLIGGDTVYFYQYTFDDNGNWTGSYLYKKGMSQPKGSTIRTFNGNNKLMTQEERNAKNITVHKIEYEYWENGSRKATRIYKKGKLTQSYSYESLS